MKRSTHTSGPTRIRRIAGALRHQPLVMMCLLYIGLLLLFSIVPGLIAPSDPTDSSIGDAMQGPGMGHLFGTDAIGRDVFSRVIHGARISLSVSALAVCTGLAIGGALGVVSGYLGGMVDTVIMRAMDVMLAFPGVLLAMAIIAARGRGLENLVLAIGIAAVPNYARFVRGQVLGLRNLPFIEGSIASGATPLWIMTRHIVPNLARPVLVLATIGAGFALLSSSALSFIGLGAQPPAPEWGAMLSDGRAYLSDAWWIGAFPGLAIFLTVIAVNVVGQWLREQTGRI